MPERVMTPESEKYAKIGKLQFFMLIFLTKKNDCLNAGKIFSIQS